MNAARTNAPIVPNSAHNTTATIHVFNATLSTPATAINAHATPAHTSHDPPASPARVTPTNPNRLISIALYLDVSGS
ncbi:hypothetical protein GCM10009827_104890 [Dactylosporangium maewongense]|uniref:Uncharacterized protein n=1 Tax=Dactylosporangium maewongense TaxID=634393 RepID=A0ABP4NTB4_9ACTN